MAAKTAPIQFLTIPQTAARLAVSTKTVYRLVYAGRLTGHPVSTGRKRPNIRIDEAELTALQRGER